MIDDLGAQLKDANPEVRRRAVIALGRSKDIAALRPLAEVFRTDPDPEVRELARKAGLYIRRSQPDAAQTPPAEPLPRSGRSLAELAAAARGEDDASDIRAARRIEEARRQRERIAQREREPEKPKPTAVGDDGEVPNAPGARTISIEDYGFVRGKKYIVSPEEEARARKNVDAALTLNMNGKNDKAVKALAAALKSDPNLINDGYFNSVASSITGKEGDEAIAMLISGKQRADIIKTHKREAKKQRLEKHMEKVSEGTSRGLAFEIIVYLIINAVFPVLIVLISIQGLVNLAQQVMQLVSEMPELEGAPEVIAQLETTAGAFNQVLIPTLLVTAVTSSIAGLLLLTVNGVITHVVANLLGGRGRLIYQLTQVAAVYNKWMPFFYVLVCIVTALVFVVFPWPLLCGAPLMVLFLMFIVGKAGQKVGESYLFGSGLGCIAYLLASIISYLVYGLIGALIGSAVGEALSGILPVAPV
jgi:hypothetical protein